MATRGKKYRNALQLVDRNRRYSVDEAVGKVLETKVAKFDESVDIALKLGVDPKQADQMVRGSVSLPNGTGKTVRVLVFVKGEKEKEALDAGADYVGSDDLIEKIAGGWLDFDRTVATPDMMKNLGKVARILGTRGLMPNPKLGTVTLDVAKAVKEIKAGKVDFKVDKNGILHCGLGKSSFGAEKLKENFMAFIERIVKMKPSSSKGTYMRTATLSTTMGPGVKLDTLELAKLIK